MESSPRSTIPTEIGEGDIRLGGEHEGDAAEGGRGNFIGHQVGGLDGGPQLQSSKRRQTPPVATLENPPGDPEKGSAWMLPEVIKL